MTAKVRPKENMTPKVRPTEDEVPRIEESSPKRLRAPPIMISASELRRLVDGDEKHVPAGSDETYEERVAKELRVKVSDLRSVRIEVSDPQWLRTPWLWPLVTDDMPKVIDEHCLPGVVTRAFSQSAELLWEMSTIKQLSKLRQDFINILTVFDAVRQLPPKLVADRIRPMIRQAYDNVHEMNATNLPLESRSPYLMALSLNATHFGLGEEAAMKKAVYAIKVDKSTFNKPHQAPNQPTQKRNCRVCGESVLDFKQHNKTCKRNNKMKQVENN